MVQNDLVPILLFLSLATDLNGNCLTGTISYYTLYSKVTTDDVLGFLYSLQYSLQYIAGDQILIGGGSATLTRDFSSSGPKTAPGPLHLPAINVLADCE